MSHSLKHKTLTSAGWSLLENILSLGVTFVVGLVLSRLLTPVEFGVIGIVLIFIAFGNTFIEIGFNAALIRKVDIKQDDYDTVFWSSAAMGLLLYGLLWVGAPFIASFFNQPDIHSEIRITGLMLPLGALAVVQRAMMSRQFDFRSQTIVMVVSVVLSGALGIVMAVRGYGVWSLVSQILTRTALQTVLFWILGRWIPRWVFSKTSFQELFSYSSKLLGAAFLETLYKNIYTIVIGKVYLPATLGQYNRAQSFANMISSTLTNVVQRVTFPAMSTIQTDPVRLKEAYRRIITTTMIVVFALMLGLAAVAKPLILILIGEKWLPAVSLLQLLCLSEMFYPLHAINLNIINVIGRTDVFLKLEIIKKAIAVPVILVGIFWGLDQMLWCGIAVSVVSYLLNAHYSASLIGYSLGEQLGDIVPLLGISLCVSGVMWSVTFLNLNIYAMFGIQVLVGLLLAVGIYEKLKLREYIEIKVLSLQLLTKLRNGRK